MVYKWLVNIWNTTLSYITIMIGNIQILSNHCPILQYLCLIINHCHYIIIGDIIAILSWYITIMIGNGTNVMIMVPLDLPL